jgi:hypothetical protein
LNCGVIAIFVLGVQLEVLIDLPHREDLDRLGVPRRPRDYGEFHLLFEVHHIVEETLEAALALVREAASPSEVVNDDVRFDVDHEGP